MTDETKNPLREALRVAADVLQRVADAYGSHGLANMSRAAESAAMDARAALSAASAPAPDWTMEQALDAIERENLAAGRPLEEEDYRRALEAAYRAGALSAVARLRSAPPAPPGVAEMSEVYLVPIGAPTASDSAAPPAPTLPCETIGCGAAAKGCGRCASHCNAGVAMCWKEAIEDGWVAPDLHAAAPAAPPTTPDEPKIVLTGGGAGSGAFYARMESAAPPTTEAPRDFGDLLDEFHAHLVVATEMDDDDPDRRGAIVEAFTARAALKDWVRLALREAREEGRASMREEAAAPPPDPPGWEEIDALIVQWREGLCAGASQDWASCLRQLADARARALRASVSGAPEWAAREVENFAAPRGRLHEALTEAEDACSSCRGLRDMATRGLPSSERCVRHQLARLAASSPGAPGDTGKEESDDET